MRFGLFTALATAAAVSALTSAAEAQSTTRVVRNGDHTVITSRDETGRTRTRIVVQKRSYLDPGTQVFPGEVRYNDSIQAVQTRPSVSFERTVADRDRETLPRFDLPFPSPVD